MTTIKEIKGREVLDSRGNPTVEVDVITSSGKLGRAIVPSGASTGSREALEMRDKDTARYMGKGVLKAVEHVNTIIHETLNGKNVSDQKAIDQALLDLDGTENKSKLGANAILGVSMAVAQAAAAEAQEPLFQYLNTLYNDQTDLAMPVPMMNILNGGEHANNSVDIQEFMIMPHNAISFSDALRKGVEVFHHLKKLLDEKGYSTAVGDEGGFAPSLSSSEEAIECILEAISNAGYRPGDDISIALDVAASELYTDGAYVFKGEGVTRGTDEMIAYYDALIEKYPIVSIEDGLDESDWDGWAKLTQMCGSKVQLVGDDLFVTNPSILEEGIKKQVGNAILIKLNQIGTVTETMMAIRKAQDAHFGVVVSHRSGESEDTFISDLSVATQAGQIKTGSLCRTDRTCKYNQLLRIAEVVEPTSHFLGKKVFAFLG